MAELTGERAIAIIVRSQPHSHAEITETSRVLRGTLLVVCVGMGCVLQLGNSITIIKGQIHHTKYSLSRTKSRFSATLPGRADDHFVLT